MKSVLDKENMNIQSIIPRPSTERFKQIIKPEPTDGPRENGRKSGEAYNFMVNYYESAISNALSQVLPSLFDSNKNKSDIVEALNRINENLLAFCKTRIMPKRTNKNDLTPEQQYG